MLQLSKQLITKSQQDLMSANKKLPMLKLLLFPVVAGVAYSAYCYYSQQYQQKKQKIHAPILYMQQLHKILTECNSTDQLQKVYGLMSKHMNVFVIDPSDRDERLIDSSVGREIDQDKAVSSKFKVQKDYEVNYFNYRKQKKQGRFTLGIWSDLNEVSLHSIKLAEPMIKLAQKSIKMRQDKCRSIADTKSKHIQKGYLQEYIECITNTEKSAVNLSRQIDIANKMLKFQLDAN